MSTSTASDREARVSVSPAVGRLNAVGVEAGDGWVRCARRQGRGECASWRLSELRLDMADAQSTRPDSAQLRKQARRGGIPGGRAICALASPGIDIFPLSLEPHEGESLDALVVAQVPGQISYPLSDAVLDYAVLPQRVTRPGSAAAVLVFCAPRGLVEPLLERLDGLGLRVDRLLTPSCALAPWIGRKTPEERHLLIATGEEASAVAVVQYGQVLLERFLPWGLRDLCTRLQGELGLSPTQCRALLAPPQLGMAAEARDAAPAAGADACGEPGATPLEEALSEILGPSFQQLSREAAGCLAYCDAFLQHEAAADLLLVGPLAGHRALRRFLERDLELPVRSGTESLPLAGWPERTDAGNFVTAACCALWPEESRS